MKKVRLQKVEFVKEPHVTGRDGYTTTYDITNERDAKRIKQLFLYANGWVEVEYIVGQNFKPDSCKETKPVFMPPNNVVSVVLADGETFFDSLVAETPIQPVQEKRAKKEKTQ